MIDKFLEAFFRHKLLLLLPPLLIPLLVGPAALFLASSYYESFAGVWISRPTYLSYSDDANRYVTPAQDQSGRIAEQVRTRAFIFDVARRAPLLAPLANSDEGRQRLLELVGAGFAATAGSNNLVVLRFRSDSAELSYQVLNAIIQAYTDRLAADRIGQGDLATGFYESRVQAADEQLAKANEALRRYVAANPRLTTLDPTRGASATTAARLGLPAMAIDPELAELLRRVESAQRDADRGRDSLDKTQLDVAAALEGQEQGFQVIDPPQRSTTITQERRKLIVFPVAGFVGGLAISAILLVLLVVGDRSVRSTGDLTRTVRIVGVVPSLQLKRLPKRAGSDSARRAIGFVAGAALPPPRAAR